MENILAEIAPDILAIILLLYLLAILQNNMYFSGKKETVYAKTVLLSLFVTILEILTIVFNNQSHTEFRIPHMICNMLGFGLSPWVCYQITILYSNGYYRRQIYLTIPMILQSVIAIISVWTGWIFYISQDNVYHRGPLFVLNPIASLYSFILLIVILERHSRKYEHREKKFLHLIYLIILFGNAIQICFPKVLLIWSTVSISLVFYYVFMRELQSKFDPLTGSNNRNAYQIGLCHLQRQEYASVCFLDINNLKIVNDKYGHDFGDRYLQSAAKVMEKCFYDVGTVYRIGGDEFCILCPGKRKEDMTSCIAALEAEIKEQQNLQGPLFSIAYGVAYWTKKSKENIQTCIKRADQAMYHRKQEYKKQKNVLKSNTIND